VRRFDQVKHLVDDDELQKVLRLLYEFGVQADGPRTVVALSVVLVYRVAS